MGGDYASEKSVGSGEISRKCCCEQRDNKKDTGIVTIFAFDKSQGLSEHTAPFDALVNIIEGQAEITISGKPFIVKDGEMIIMPANEPHSLKAVEKFKMLLVMIKK